MAAYKGDIRYRGVCRKCGNPLGDWALEVPVEKRVCYDCKPRDIKNIPYKKGVNI